MSREIDDELGLKPKSVTRYVVIAYTTCPRCAGTGAELWYGKKLECFDCNGNGEVPKEVNLVEVLQPMQDEIAHIYKSLKDHHLIDILK